MEASDDSAPLPHELCRFRSFGSKASDGRDMEEVYATLQGRLRFRDITTFNDPFEAKPQYVAAYDDPRKQRDEMIRYLAAIAPGGGSASSRRRWAADRLREKPMDELIKALDEKRATIGAGEAQVLCMMHPDVVRTPLPWAHYADAHQGVCIHLDTTKLPVALAFQVEYGDEYPKLVVPRTAQGNWERVRAITLRKSQAWSYEREYRVTRLNLPDAGFASHLNVVWDGDTALAQLKIVKAVTLGCRMEESVQERLTTWIQENVPHIEIWRAATHRTRYEIERHRVA